MTDDIRTTHYRPGQFVPASGQWWRRHAIFPNYERQVTCVKGERFPPGPVEGCYYERPDVTRHA